LFQSHRRAWVLATSGAVCALVLGGALVACGGGTESSVSARGTAQSDAISKAAVVYPNGSPSTTQEACTDAVDFARISGSLGEIGLDNALVNRHVDCRVATTDAIEVTVPLALSEDGSTYSYVDANTPASSTTNNYILGTIVVSTKLTSYGPSTVLSKNYNFELTVDSFVPDPTYPGPDKRPAVLMQPVLDCNSNVYNSLPGTCTPNLLPQVRLNLDGTPGSGSFAVNFNWVKDDTQTSDLEVFLLRIQRFNLAVDGGFGLQLPSGSSPQYFDPKVTSYPSRLRCDRDVAHVGTSGCVYEQAAAVFVLRLDNPLISEAAEHIKFAQAGGVPPADPEGPPNSGQLAPSPGKFLFKPGSRALADDSIMGQDKALQRLKNTAFARKYNRDPSCFNTDSLIKIRKPEPSSSCKVDPSACSCDEYPFPSTWRGAGSSPGTTSVRLINDAQNNSAGGGTLTQWYRNERVIDPTVYPTDNSAPSRGDGDRFWVHIPEQ
jgi:hypothetical protein